MIQKWVLSIVFVSLTVACSGGGMATMDAAGDSGADVSAVDTPTGMDIPAVDTPTGMDIVPAVDNPVDIPLDAGQQGTSDTGVDVATVDTDTCNTPMVMCGTSCTDPETDPHHCGSCTQDCTTLPGVDPVNVHCTHGVCDPASACLSGHGHCSTNPMDGCETDLSMPIHCGSCTTLCNEPTPLCTMTTSEDGGAPAYRCASGCSGMTPTRCGGMCVDLQTNPASCGSCGEACPSITNGIPSCSAGTCTTTCNLGFHLCGTRCVGTMSVDTCGTSCSSCPAPPANATATCDGLTCGFTCNPGFHRCGDHCASNTAVSSCGSSCDSCPVPASGTATCDGMTCGISCNSGFHACAGSCSSNADVNTCGASCSPCAAPPAFATVTCDGSSCGFVCTSGYHRCGGTCSGNSDTSSCGTSCSPCMMPVHGTATCDGTSCGIVCDPGFHLCGATCVSATATTSCGASCSPCPPPPANATATCNGTACGFACNPGFHLCGGVCQSDMDPASCGSACTPCLAPAHGLATCSMGACDFACVSGFFRCGSACVGPTDPTACGTSCTPCPIPANATATCISGACGFTCLTGFADCDGDPTNGCEVNTRTDSYNCGTCGHACPFPGFGTVSCAAGACVLTCDAGYRSCGATCTSIYDATACGTSCTRCPVPVGGYAYCDGTACGSSCGSGFHVCGTACVSGDNTATCGTSCTPCPALTYATTTCDGTSCGLICVPGYGLIAGACVLSPPQQIAPLSTATVTSRRPTLHWSLGPVLTGAHVTLCRDRSLTSRCVALDATGASAAPTSDLAPGVWFWRLTGKVGTAVGTTTSPTWQFTVGVRTAPVDTSWGTTPDFNGDGYADVAVSSGSGVQVYPGGPSGISTSPAMTLPLPTGTTPFANNSAIASAGDVNGDGYSDLIVGNRDVDEVSLYYGGASGLSSSPVTITGTTFSTFGAAVAGAGDLNGDGYGDLVIGAPWLPYGNGDVYVYLGSAAGPGSTPTHLTGPLESHYGVSVAGAGDVNGDGYGDLLIGMLGNANLILGGPLGLGASPIILSGFGVVFGTPVAGAGDVDGDGYADVMVASDGGSYNSVSLFRGGPSGIAGIMAILSGSQAFGNAITGAGDINADGFADVAVGTNSTFMGTASIFLGGSTGIATTAAATFSGTYDFGNHVAGLGDINGDGFADLGVTAPFTGNAFIYLGGLTGLVTVLPTLTDPVGASYFGRSIALLNGSHTGSPRAFAAWLPTGHVARSTTFSRLTWTL